MEREALLLSLEIVVGLIWGVDVVFPEQMNRVNPCSCLVNQLALNGCTFLNYLQFHSGKIVDGHFHLNVFSCQKSFLLLLFSLILVIEIDQAGFMRTEFCQTVYNIANIV